MHNKNIFFKLAIIISSLFLAFSYCYGDNILPEAMNIESESFKDSEIVQFISKKTAKITILNKITAKSDLVEFKIGETKSFGNILIKVEHCLKNTDPLSSSSLMLLDVLDNKSNSGAAVFHGWMDSNNLSISTLEHPIYEILPKECID